MVATAVRPASTTTGRHSSASRSGESGSARAPTLCSEASSCMADQRSHSSTQTSTARALPKSESVAGLAELSTRQLWHRRLCSVVADDCCWEAAAAAAGVAGRAALLRRRIVRVGRRLRVRRFAARQRVQCRASLLHKQHKQHKQRNPPGAQRERKPGCEWGSLGGRRANNRVNSVHGVGLTRELGWTARRPKVI